MIATYLAALRALRASGVPYVVIGGLALHLRYGALLDLPVRDCDLLLPSAAIGPDACTAALCAQGWRVRSWQDDVHPPLDPEMLAGRYYLRATQGNGIIDATYEYDAVTWPEAEAAAELHAGVPVAAPAHLIALMAARDSAQDRARIAAVRKLAGL
ncbi:hypothetical protein LTV02_32315 [Nocardia yamanashiensis]|uniref:hypothetical protein n=1 Tax=Nocardia yamanashiensis TaxID=209247 RepID=UPI001E5E66EA|nr:hypothetical protein [Nocardia yamanashiensis]UGT40638.1 hypothetical protein LTV02_32315 [Nocardia yamanashiensis]